MSATNECVEKIYAARNAYDALKDSLRPSVTNYGVLTAAETNIASMITPDETSLATQADIETFLNGFNGVTLENLKTVNAAINALDGEISALTALQRYSISNLEDYYAAKSTFKVIDDMTGGDIASRFNLKGANGINNGDTAPSAASVLNDSTYGKCATIGKSTEGLEIRYAAKDNLDLSGYTHVLIGVKNNLGVTVNVQNCVSGATLVSGLESGKFATVILTVNEFINQGIAIWVNNEGTVWLTSIVAVTLTDE
ncbi:MAG: hypothetical protein J6Y43_06335 [Clostridia bacterium]|nr:hypothetical protein [Clostridia bacterium]